MSGRVAELLAELSQRGISVRPVGAFLGVSPRSALTPELLARIRELKGEILSSLASLPPAPAYRFPYPLGATPAERSVLLAIAAARTGGVRWRELAATTRLCKAVLDAALSSLRGRREIESRGDGRFRLVVH